MPRRFAFLGFTSKMAIHDRTRHEDVWFNDTILAEQKITAPRFVHVT